MILLRALRERFRALGVLVMSRFQARFWEDGFLEKTSAALNPEAEKRPENVPNPS